MYISIGCDHTALELKNAIIVYLKSLGHIVEDRGTFSKDSCDYTDYGVLVAEDIYKERADRGIVICSTGIGMSIIANKVHGVRCALIGNEETARLTREHNDSNCLALAAKYLSEEQARKIVSIWLDTPFSNSDRHQRRINKIKQYEELRK